MKLNLSQRFSYYLLPIWLGCLALVPIYFAIAENKNDRLNTNGLIITGIILSLIAIIVLIRQKKSLQYYIIASDLPVSVKGKIIKNILKDYNWRIETNKENLIQATGSGFRDNLDLRSWGELISIKLGPKEILINSICDPDNIFAQAFSFGKNRQNIRDFEFIYLERIQNH